MATRRRRKKYPRVVLEGVRSGWGGRYRIVETESEYHLEKRGRDKMDDPKWEVQTIADPAVLLRLIGGVCTRIKYGRRA